MRAYTRQFPHVADIRLAIYADTLNELFAEAARVIAAYGAPIGGGANVKAQARLSSRDAATLLADWINELLGRSEIDRVAYRHAAVELEVSDAETILHADLTGLRVREWRCPIKAATYHGLRLEHRRGRWRAEVLCDA